MNITEKIQPIRLLSGSHKDTGSTGQGCFMNVVAYLNGEAQITDQSECVCYVIRPLAIWFNDWLEDEERHGLIPFIERALGSRTDDKAEITRRLKLVGAFAELQRDLAAKSAALSAAEYAKYRSITKAEMLKLLDEALPKAQEAEPIIYQRAAKLIELSAN